MSWRYLLVVGNDGSARRLLLHNVGRVHGLIVGFTSEHLAALVAPDCPCITLGETGCILGSLFHRRGLPERIRELTSSEQQFAMASAGQSLLVEFWGCYVAAIGGPDDIRILRDPSGILPCYYTCGEEFLLVASDAELLADAGADVSVKLGEIGRQLYRANVPSCLTALGTIRELLAGFAIQLGLEQEPQKCCWSPWDHLDHRDVTHEQAAEHLSRVVRYCVRAWSSTSRRVLLSVSGGLDSSIIAAVLAGAETDVTCLTMFTDDPAGDERTFARDLCAHLGLTLVEWPYRLEDIDIAQPLAPHLPRPKDRTQMLAYERVHLEVAAELRADTFMTGNGGDSVFGYSQSAAPIADRYLSQGLGRGTFDSLLDVCRQTGCNIPDALRRAWHLVRRSPRFEVAPKPLLLNPEFVAALAPVELRHPWLYAPAGTMPGKAAHIASILRVQPHLDAGRAYHLPLISPLMSQPIVEACLAVPSWEWRAGGVDRSVARRAFAADLPPNILNRSVKGSPGGFSSRLLEHFRGPIRDRLLGGSLAASSILDKLAIEGLLTGEKAVAHAEKVRILELVNAEAWIDHWLARQSAKAGGADVRSAGHDRPLPSAYPIP